MRHAIQTPLDTTAAALHPPTACACSFGTHPDAHACCGPLVGTALIALSNKAPEVGISCCFPRATDTNAQS